MEDLSQITNLKQPFHKNLIVGFEGNEDGGVYQLDMQRDDVIVQSVDFITPVVDDPYIYGQIAAANSLSDIFAMGAMVKTALNLLMWDKEHILASEVNEILRGGLEKVLEAGGVLLGGHTISDLELKYGLSAMGEAKKHQIWRNNTAQIGDVLVLSKPIGSGIITTAMKNEKITLAQGMQTIDSMRMLNLKATQIAQKMEIHACTDITGFGLIGHSLEMCGTGGKSILFHTSAIPIFENSIELALEGFVPGGSDANKSYLHTKVQVSCNLQEDIYYYDAQTSGGLLFALPKQTSGDLVDKLRKSGYEHACIVGEIIPQAAQSIILG
nr:selenide, water dikinase SelD [Helicobacter sp. 11S03491-1]